MRGDIVVFTLKPYNGSRWKYDFKDVEPGFNISIIYHDPNVYNDGRLIDSLSIYWEAYAPRYLKDTIQAHSLKELIKKLKEEKIDLVMCDEMKEVLKNGK